ncbi:MAG: hypothetical protein MI864_10480 [Pseudomonadales bacterium]|nr:hypothetical protein [Pseudomonadales bacterium]
MQTLFVLLIITLFTCSLLFPVQLSTGILDTLPDTEHQQSELLQSAIKQAGATFSGTFSIWLGHSEQHHARAAMEALRKELSTLEASDWLKVRKPGQISPATLTEIYTPYAEKVLSPAYRNRLLDNTPEQFQRYVMGILFDMSTPFVAQTVHQDTTLSLADFLTWRTESISQVTGLKKDSSEEAVVLDGRFYFRVMAQSKKASTVDESIVLRDKLEAALERVMEATPHEQNSLTLEVVRQGALFHNAANAKRAKFEFATFGSATLMLLAFLVLFSFASTKPFGLLFGAITLALMGGWISLWVFFSTVHLVSLIFATSLLGIAIDYAFHMLCHGNRSQQYQQISRTLFMAFITTASGYIIVGLFPILILKQVAVFMCSGLLCAVLGTIWLYPRLAQLQQSSIGVRSSLINAAEQFGNRYSTPVQITCTVLLTLTALTSLAGHGLHLRYDDSIQALNSSPKALIEQEQLGMILAKQTGFDWDSRFFVITATSEQALLEKTEKLTTKLRTSHAGNGFTDYLSLSDWIPSIRAQKENQTLLSDARRNNWFAGKLNILTPHHTVAEPESVDPDAWLQPAAILSSALAESLGTLWLELHHPGKQSGVATLVLLRNVSNELELAQLAQPEDGIYWHNKPRQLTDTLARYRQLLEYIIVFSILSMFLICLLLKSPKVAFWVVTPPTLALFVSLLLSQWLLGDLNLFNLFAALLVLMLGIDYGFIYQGFGFRPLSIVSIWLSIASSCIAFGFFIFSQVPAIAHFGTTLVLGLGMLFIVAPFAARGHNPAALPETHFTIPPSENQKDV